MLVLQAGVAALVNVQSVDAVDAEMTRRGGDGELNLYVMGLVECGNMLTLLSRKRL